MKTTGIVLLLMGVAIVFHWLSEIIPALVAGRVPQGVRDSGQLTDAVAVLDLAFGAPACLIAAILLLRRKPLGFVLGPVVLTFLILSSLVLASMGVVMVRHSFGTGSVLCATGLGIAMGSAVLLVLIFRTEKAASYPDPERFSVDDHTKRRT